MRSGHEVFEVDEVGKSMKSMKSVTHRLDFLKAPGGIGKWVMGQLRAEMAAVCINTVYKWLPIRNGPGLRLALRPPPLILRAGSEPGVWR